jgi:hypothetical protein
LYQGELVVHGLIKKQNPVAQFCVLALDVCYRRLCVKKRVIRVRRTASPQGIDAILSGYGFLSENPDFADAWFASGSLSLARTVT